MTPTTRIIPNLWFGGNAEAAVAFYLDVFGGDSKILTTQRYPETGLPAFQQALAGELLVADFCLRGHRLSAINADDMFSPTPAISFMLNFDPANYPDAEAARDDLDAIWQRLADGGEVLMPLEQYDFSERYGWVQDRYGFSWQVILTDPEGDPRPFFMPAFMFGASHQNQATAAVDYWTALFAESHVGHQYRYPQPTGPATTEALMFSDFTLCGQWFAAMDSGVAQTTTFTPAVSLAVPCETQAEIDRFWDALSVVPEAEQCGWCQDQFGVSWQIVPAEMQELLQRPGTYERMLAMKKLIIADF